MTDPTPPPIALAVPEGWIDLDLDPSTRNDMIDRLVDERLAGMDEAEQLRPQIVAQLRAAAARTADAGGVLALLYCDVSDEEPHVVVASLVVTMHLSEGRLTPQQIESELGGREGAELTRVQTEAGPAIRITGRIRETYPGQPEELEVFSARFFVPFDDGAALAVLSFGTFNLDLAEDFLELFQDMAATFELGDPSGGEAVVV